MRAKYRRRSRKERSRPSRSPQSRHQPSDRLLGPLGFGVCCGRAVGVLGAIEAYGASRGYPSHTEPYRAIQSHPEQHRAIQSHSEPSTKPSCVTSPPQRFSLGVALSPYFVHRSSSSSASPSCRPVVVPVVPVAHTHHHFPLSKSPSPKQSPQMPSIVAFWHLSHNAAPSTQLWQPSRQVVVFSGGYWLLWLPFT